MRTSIFYSVFAGFEQSFAALRITAPTKPLQIGLMRLRRSLTVAAAYSPAFLFLIASNAASQQPLDVTYLYEPFEDVIFGRVDNHYSFPESHPKAYALAFEFADELRRECPNLFSDDFDEQRAYALSSLVYFQLSNFSDDPFGNFGTQGSWQEGAIQMLASPLVANLSHVIERQRIASLDLNVVVSDLVANTGGCGGSMEILADNLQAIATFGSIPTAEFRKTLTRREDSPNGVTFTCYYEVDEIDSTENSQDYIRLNTLNAYQFGTPLSLIIQRATGGAVEPLQLMLRSDCPLTIDPSFSSIKMWVNPAEGVVDPNATDGERMAAYYIDVLLPIYRNEAKREGVNIELPEHFLSELRQEIIKFEDSEVTSSRQDLRNFGDLSEWRERLDVYRDQYGTRILELEDEALNYGLSRYNFYHSSRRTIADALDLD